jgi:malonyl-CoA/methylmalonyl-CoA synthetase
MNRHLASGTEPDLLADGSLVGRWRRRWAERPSWRQLQDVDGTWLTSDELEHRTEAAARGLRAAGLRPGERLVISAPASASLAIAYIAALRAGLVVVPVNPGYTPAEVDRIVSDARPAATVADDLGSITLDRPPCEDSIDDLGPDDPAVLIYTSGTTGRPKGALLSHGNLLSSATALNLAWRWQPEDRLLLTLPLFHVHGLGVGLFGSLCAGAEVVLRPKFDPADAPGATLFFGVPTIYQRLVDSGEISALGGLRLLVSGSAPLAAALADRIADAVGQVPLERYGMTETVMLTSNPYDGPRKPGTVGFPLPGVELRLADDAEVQVRGPNVIAGYYERPDADAEAFTADGWFRTGDLGEVDGDGYLSLVGRSKELIITGGYNVHPREVEEVLAGHPAVHEVAVIGRASETWGEEVTAVVVTRQPVPEAELREFAARELVSYKVPKRVEFVDELPRNAMGKLVRGDI